MINSFFRATYKYRVLPLIVLLSFNSLVNAATSTTTFQVTASVIAACVVSATTLNFGVYNPVAGANLDATGTITTTCTNTTSYTTGLNAGTSTGATVTTRKMTGQTNPANLLPYALYRDSARTLNWGNAAPDIPPAVVGSGAPQNATVYGRIAGGTSAAIDTYLDTITVTVTY